MMPHKTGCHTPEEKHGEHMAQNTERIAELKQRLCKNMTALLQIQQTLICRPSVLRNSIFHTHSKSARPPSLKRPHSPDQAEALVVFQLF